MSRVPLAVLRSDGGSSGGAGERFEAPGFFRVGRLGDGRWTLVDPGGAPFWMCGFNHAHQLPSRLRPEFWADEVASDRAWRDFVVGFAREHGLNSIGYDWSIPRPGFPFVWRLESGTGSSTWMQNARFPDLFDPAWESGCERGARNAAAMVGGDPDLIGFFLDDVLEWPLFEASKRRDRNWIEAIKDLAPGAPGKRVWLDLMRERYASPAEFVAAWGEPASGPKARDWEDVARWRDWSLRAPALDRARARADDEAMLELLAMRYYEVTCRTLRAHAGDYLILGEPFEGNRGVPDAVLRAMAAHLDVLGVQFYGFWKDHAASIEAWHASTGLPVLLADSCFACLDPGQPRPCGPIVADQEARARAFTAYFEAARACSCVVGWNWCGFVDSDQCIEPKHQHSGLIRADKTPHPALCSAIKNCLLPLNAPTPKNGAVS